MTLVGWGIHAVVSLVAVLAGLAIAKVLFDRLTPYKVSVQIAERDSPALGMVLVGYLLGMLAILCAILPDGPRTWGTLPLAAVEMAIDAAIGVGVLLAAGLLNDRIILRGVAITNEVIDKRNLSVGVVLGATLAGVGLFVAGSLNGEHRHGCAILVAAVSEAALLGYALLLRAICPQNQRLALVDDQNLAMGIGIAGQLLAFCLVLMRGANASMAEHVSHGTHAAIVLRFAAVGAVALPLTRLAIDRWLLPAARLRHEIVEERNTNAGFVEASIAIAVGGVLAFAL